VASLGAATAVKTVSRVSCEQVRYYAKTYPRAVLEAMAKLLHGVTAEERAAGARCLR